MRKKFFMMRTIAFLLAISFLLAGCNKKSSSGGSTTVEYQVSATNSTNIDISYTNAAGGTTIVNSTGNWVFDITDPTKPFAADLKASASSPFSSITATCIVNIVVNGNIVKTATASSNTVAVAEAIYTVQ